MISIDRELDRYLTLLRNKIREKGYTQLEVQEALGWGRSYISQLLTKQKSLRLEQILAILSVIGIDAKEFFGELYFGVPRFGAGQRPPSGVVQPEAEQLTTLLKGLVGLLRKKRIITAAELSTAIQAAEAEGAESDHEARLRQSKLEPN